VGAFIGAAVVAYEPNGRYLDWLRREIADAAIDVRLGAAATPEMLSALNPDTVIVATGAGHPPACDPGIDKTHVEQAETLFDDADLSVSAERWRSSAVASSGLNWPNGLRRRARRSPSSHSDAKLGSGLPMSERAPVVEPSAKKRGPDRRCSRRSAIEDSGSLGATRWSGLPDA